ncbi:hypothetical protein GHT06_009828 [Daphnia sinensis]|uniref:BPTI/Kunitz inhibitor domain-containing protein n=1 Tax=Daphnia sinensis TaxID=1820382 RepID=A0AAD5L3R1_9CRUS|nr:hypothetical protein GHT06_009828 [Daphnia sinensis]
MMAIRLFLIVVLTCVYLTFFVSAAPQNRVSRAAAFGCYQPMQKGLCRGFFERYYYNPSSRSCQSFIYSGCGENANNFRSLSECSQTSPLSRALTLDPVCLQPPIADASQNCNNFSVRWYFDAVDGDCEDFVYSGCGGSENVFDSEFACEVRCENVHDRMNSFESAEKPVPINPVCLLPPINPTVRCNNFSLKWYYDPRTRDCEKILYSGCGGSKNLFNTENACERLCDYDNFDSYESAEDFQNYQYQPSFKFFSIGK